MDIDRHMWPGESPESADSVITYSELHLVHAEYF